MPHCRVSLKIQPAGHAASLGEKVLLCSPGWPGTGHVDQAGLRLTRSVCLCLAFVRMPLPPCCGVTLTVWLSPAVTGRVCVRGACGSFRTLSSPSLQIPVSIRFHTLTAVPRACEVTVWKLYSFSFPDLKSSGIMTPGASDLAM